MNPFLAPLFWSLSATIGTYLIGGNPKIMVDAIKHASSTGEYGILLSDIVIPYLLGNILLASVCAALGYFLTVKLVTRYRKKKG